MKPNKSKSITMSRRRKLLEQLSLTEVGINWEPVMAGYFRVLYGLPFQLQIELAIFMMRRYLPIFERREPEIKWPRIILDNVAQWVEEHHRGIPTAGKFEYLPDSAFNMSFDGLVAAYCHRDKPFFLTESSLCAVKSAISARRSNVWAADDPEAVEIWERQRENPEIFLLPSRWASNNLAAYAVIQREWHEVGKWLWQQEVGNYPDEVNIEEMEEYLDYWRSNEMISIVPEWLDMLSKARQREGQEICQSQTESELETNSSSLLDETTFDETTPRYYTIPAETPNPQVEYLILKMSAISTYYSLASVGYFHQLNRAEVAIAAHALFERGEIRVRVFAGEDDEEGTPNVSLTMGGIQDNLNGRIKALYYLTPQGSARWEALSHPPD